MKLTYFVISVAFAVCTTAAAQRDILHYDYPARYFEQTLLIGNGSQGVTIYGDPTNELLELNDITLWTGEADNKTHNTTAAGHIPTVRSLLDKELYAETDRAQRLWQGHYSEAYMPLGSLRFVSDGDSKQTVADYYRQLNLADATATVTFSTNDGRYERTYFASAPDSVIVMRYRAMDGAKITGKFSFDSQLPHHVNAGEMTMTMDGYAAYHSLPGYYQPSKQHYWYDENRGVHFRAMLELIPVDGIVQNDGIQGVDSEGLHRSHHNIGNGNQFQWFRQRPCERGQAIQGHCSCAVGESKVSGMEKTYGKPS